MTAPPSAVAGGTGENPGSMDIPPGALWCEDVARLWGVSRSTVWSYLTKSRRADPATGRKAGRYANDPVPKPDGRRGRYPYWHPDREPELVAWKARTYKRKERGRSS